METVNDINDLILINRMLNDYLKKLIAEKSELSKSFLNILRIGSDEVSNNENELIRLLKTIGVDNKIHEGLLLNEWNRSILLNQLKAGDSEIFECENRVVNAVEAYKTALCDTFLTNSTCRYILMDQKCFLQSFLLDLIKNRELDADYKQPASKVYI